MDVDICGPSVPKLMRVEGQEVVNSQYGWQPLKLVMLEALTSILQMNLELQSWELLSLLPVNPPASLYAFVTLLCLSQLLANVLVFIQVFTWWHQSDVRWFFAAKY